MIIIGLDFGTTAVRGVVLELVLDACDPSSSSKQKRLKITGTHSEVYQSGLCEDARTNSVVQRNPQDWVDAAEKVLAHLMESNPDLTAQPLRIGVAFTSCTILPVDANGEALCTSSSSTQFPSSSPETRPHLYPKVWKHHTVGVQRVADELTSILGGDGVTTTTTTWLETVYGGSVGLEYFVPKVIEVYDKDREVFEAAYTFIEAGDWIVHKLASRGFGGRPTTTSPPNKRARALDSTPLNIPRSTCQAGYKNFYDVETKRHRVSPQHLTRLRSSLSATQIEKIIDRRGEFLAPGSSLPPSWGGVAANDGDRETVRIGVIDAHAAAFSMGCAVPGTLVAILGTSGCVMLCVDRLPVHELNGICGAIRDGISPNTIGIETGLSAVGDLFAFLSRFTNRSLEELEKEAERELLDAGKRNKKKCWAIDHFNGSRTPFMRGDLTGSLRDLTVHTSPGEVHLCLCESVAFALRLILETLRGVDARDTDSEMIRRIVFAGGVVSSSSVLRVILKKALSGETLKLSAIPDVATAVGAGLLAVSSSEVIGSEIIKRFVDEGVVDFPVVKAMEESGDDEDWGSEMRYQRYRREVFSNAGWQ